MLNIYNWNQTYWPWISMMTLSFITTLSLWPLDTLPLVPGSDKTHHFLAYATLMLPVAFGKPEACLKMFIIFLCFSGGIELIQPYVNRYGEWLDLFANAIGLCMGWLLGTSAHLYSNNAQN